MGRKIILLSDGTGNSAAKVWRTNVWRVFESLDLSGSTQVAFYDDGVGTSSFKPLAILGGAFGYGLKRNVIDLYKFVCRNVRSKNDEIFGFGFSRGAFTIRVVMGLILEQGIIPATSEKELHRKAKAAYRDYRRRNFHTKLGFTERCLRLLRDVVIPGKYSKDDNSHDIKISFLGLWDTVAAYGMPIEEMTRGISDWIFPLLLPGFKLDERVARACHALSIDDERTTFHPVLWDERAEPPLVPRQDGKRYLADERISQVWFAGVHSNVGGGYPDDSLAHIPLVWIMAEAEEAGIAFKSKPEASPQTLMHPPTAQDKDGRQYDPRKGMGGYYRYGPRDIGELCKDLLARKGPDGVRQKAIPKIHETALARIKNNAHAYAPNGLPADYDIVTANGEVLALKQANPIYETPERVGDRVNFQHKIWNVVWQRRIVYFLTVFTSIYLFAFPLMKSVPAADEKTTSLRWVSDAVRMLGAILPTEAAATWINGFARQPFRLLAVVTVLVILLYCGSRLAGNIQNGMRTIWAGAMAGTLPAAAPPDDFIYRLRTHKIYRAVHYIVKRHVLPIFFALTFVYIGFALFSHVLFMLQDDAGWVCEEKPKTEVAELAPGESVVIPGTAFANRKTIELLEFNPANPCQNLGVTLEENKIYRVEVVVTEKFQDNLLGRDASKGIYFFDPASASERFLRFALLPLRRELIRPWYRIVLRYGAKGGEETFLDPDPEPTTPANPPDPTKKIVYVEKIKPPRDGQLFMFVNDAVLAIPGHYGVFYNGNKGAVKITITQQKPCFVCDGK